MPTSDLLTTSDVRNQVLLERLKEGEHKKFEAFLRKLEKGIRGRLSDEGETITSKKRLNALLVDLNRLQGEIYDDYTGQLILDLSDIGVQQAKYQADALESVTVDFESKLPAKAQVLTAIRVNPLQVEGYTGDPLLEPFIKDWSKTQTKRVNTAIQQGFYQGRTTAQITSDIRGTSTNNFNDGELAKVNRANRTIVRTAVQHASTQARVKTMTDNDDLVKGYEWVSTLDSRTSQTCFTGRTKINPWFDIEKLYRADYTGEIITVRLSTGEQIEGTPNHPVLTCRGWAPLGKIDPSKHVIYTARHQIGQIGAVDHIGVVSEIGEFFDSARKIPAVDVLPKSTSATDFYGDAVGFNGDITVVDIKGFLRGRRKASLLECLIYKSLRIIKNSVSLLTLGVSNFVSMRGLPAVKTSKVTTHRVKRKINKAFGKSCFSNYVSWSFARLKHIFNYFLISNRASAPVEPCDWLSDSDLGKKAGNSCGRSFIASSNAGCALTTLVSKADIISVRTEFKSCHVYTLQTSQGYYTAGGAVVKNCMSLDGRQFKFGEGPLAPIHPNCRSTISPVLDSRFDFLDKGATRSSKGASGGKQVAASETYYSWLKKQPASFQDTAIGETHGKLLRNGGITADEFAKLSLNRNFKPLTLDEMKRKAPEAFERAGL